MSKPLHEMNSLSYFRRTNQQGHDENSSIVSVQQIALAIVCGGFALAWLLPYHTFPYWTFYNDYVSVAAIDLALLVVLLRKSIVDVLIPKAVLLPLALAGLITLHALAGKMAAPFDAVIAVGYLLATAAAMIFAFNAFDGPAKEVRTRTLIALSIALVVAGALSSFITLFQYLGVDDLLGDWSTAFTGGTSSLVRPYANLGQPNQLSLILCWSLMGLWLLHQTLRLGSTLSTVIAVLLLTSLALTQSKVGWVILPTVAAAVILGNGVSDVRRIAPSAVLALLAWFVVIVVSLPTIGSLIGSPTQSIGERMQTNGVRGVMMLEGLYIGFQNFWFGVGWASFGGAQVQYAWKFADTQYANHAHNLVANLAAETGWIFTTLFCVIAVRWLYSRMIKARLTKENLFAAAIFAAVIIHSMVEFPLWYAYVLVPVGLVIGSVEALSDGGRGRMAGWTVSRNAMVSVALIGGCCLAVMASDYRQLVQAFRAFGFSRVGLEYADGSVERPTWTTFPHYYDYLEFAAIRPTVQMSPQQIESAESVARRFGYAPVLMRLSTIYALNGKPDEALQLIGSLKRLYPARYPEAYAAWKQMALEYPSVLDPVFKRLPPKDPLYEEKHQSDPVATPPTSLPASPPTPHR